MTKKTIPDYLADSYAHKAKATVLAVEIKGNQTSVVLNRTIFYPQGGGQPSDQGVIESPTGSLRVFQVSYNNGSPLHAGKLQGSLQEGDEVSLTLDWSRRYKNMQHHTAGHILDEAVKELFPEIKGIAGSHGIAGKNFIIFSGIIDATQATFIQKKVDQIIQANETLTFRRVTPEIIRTEKINLPFDLPKNKPLRLLRIGSRYPVPDGGTQLHSTAESWPVQVTDFEYQDHTTLIHYRLLPPQVKERVSSETKTCSSYSLNEFSASLSKIRQNSVCVSEPEEYKIRFLGKKGLINQLSSQIPKLTPSQRSQAGSQLNQLKQEIQTKITESGQTELTDSTWLDVTAPGILPPQGNLHPITRAIEEITHIFESIGFTRVRYPEVDYDWYVFEALNMPPRHPARDEWETFFVDCPSNREKGELVLTPQTSNGQVREMERVKTPPIRMLNIAKCYRRQQDVTHTAMFHQFEGLVIDKGINIQHLKGTLDYFAGKFYGPGVKSRIRPFMFKFTEPSFEVDFSCTHCQGKGCRFCKSGWHEVGGAGMVHPNVLLSGKIDPEIYTGFAFGWGVERVYTLKPGLELDDIRPFYANDLKFLQQF